MTYKVFVSSTYLDNVKRRRAVIEAIRSIGMVSVDMETMVPETREQAERCIREARDADVVVAILAWRYGWIPPGYDKSVTELEIDANPQRLVLLIDEDEPVVVREALGGPPDRGSSLEKLDALKKSLSEKHAVTFFTERSLAAKVVLGLQRWKDEREETPTAHPPADDEEARYRTLALKLHGDAKLIGFPEVRFDLKLTHLHVEVEAALDLRGEGGAEFGDYAEAKRLRDEGGYDARALPLKTAFADAERRGKKGLALLGEPGSGKTTHAQRTLLWVLEDGSESVGLAPGYLPLLLPLSAFVAPEKGFVPFARGWIASEFAQLGEDFADRVLRRERLLLLLDGLDELRPGADRALVAAELKNLLEENPTWRALVTCRFAGYQERLRLVPKYQELHLPTFTDAQVARFVENWFRTVEKQLQPDPDDAERVATERAEELNARFGERDMLTPRMTELRRNPLLLAILCLVFREEHGQLPRRRVELYRRCVDVLLRRWAERVDEVGLSPEESLQLLRPLAAWMHGKGSKRRERNAVEKQLERILAERPDLAGRVEPASFLTAVREDCGLLTGWSDEHFGFLHLGLQEYLTAVELHARATDDEQSPVVIAELAGHLREEWWQEVLLLVLSLDGPCLFEPLMAAMLEQDGAAEQENLFGYALEDAAETSATPFVCFLERDTDGDNKEAASRCVMAERLLRRIDPKAAEQVLIDTVLRAVSADEPDATERVRAPRGGYDLVRIPGGTFRMGSPQDEAGRFEAEDPRHEVVVPNFFLGVAPVTNEEYARFLEANPEVEPPEYWGNRSYNQARQPVVGVSWDEAQKYCDWAGLRLPTEAEWEYACRAGTETRFWSGDSDEDLARVGWYRNNAEQRLHPVGEKPANPFGLVDVHGNVWEWCQDAWSGNYEESQRAHPAAYEVKETSPLRVVRGGSWFIVAEFARSAYRSRRPPDYRFQDLGFRAARAHP